MWTLELFAVIAAVAVMAYRVGQARGYSEGIDVGRSVEAAVREFHDG